MATETEKAWAAGFFDGEGSTTFQLRCQLPRGKGQLKISVTQAGEFARELLIRFQSAVGNLGHICFVTDNRPNHQKCQRWYTGDRSDVCLIMQYLWPYLGPVKRRQFLAAMEKVNHGSRME